MIEAKEKPVAPPAAPLTLRQRAAWEFLGITRDHWFRLKSAGSLPKPVAMPESKSQHWRRADLERWVEKLKAFRPQQQGDETE